MEQEVSILYQAPNKGIGKGQVEAILSEQYNRRIHSRHEPSIDTIWEKKLKENPRLFNGSKFRLHSIIDKGDKTIFKLGITGYKDFIATNWATNAKDLLGFGKEDHGSSQAYMSDALGVGAFLRTSDDFMVLIKRSQHVGEAQGLWDIPGGHPEPEELIGQVDDPREIQLSELNSQDVVDEIFGSTLREIRDEVNVPIDSLSEPILLGVSLNHTSAFRPSAKFLVRCSLTSPEIQQCYDSGGVEADESTAIKFCSVTGLTDLPESPLWQDMAPSGKGCVVIYNQTSFH